MVSIVEPAYARNFEDERTLGELQANRCISDEMPLKGLQRLFALKSGIEDAAHCVECFRLRGLARGYALSIVCVCIAPLSTTLH